MTMRIAAMLILAGLWNSTVGAGEIAAPDQETSEGLKYSTTWYGASWPGGPKWVQSHISYLSVLPDGRILTASPWDEAHREQSLYSTDGELLGGYNTTQCRVVGGDGQYVYAPFRVKGDDRQRLGIERFHVERFVDRQRAHGGIPYNERWAEPAPFEGGTGPNGNRLVLIDDVAAAVPHAEGDGRRPGQQLRGIASNGRTLVVAEDISHRVHVIDAETMRPRHTFSVKYPGPVALDADERLWVIVRPERSEGFTENAQELGKYRIVQFTLDGKPTGREVRDVLVPSDLAIGGPNGYLYVADVDPSRLNVHIFDLSGDVPRRVGELGEPGGVYAGPVPGRMGTHRFDVLSGVGVDAEGHVVVSTRSRAGTFLRRFSPDGKTMLWQRYTAQFMNRTAFDPAYDGTVVFGSHGGFNRFVLHYDRDDRLDSWVAVTSDPFRFPDDHRGYRGDAVRMPNGKLYMVTDRHSHGTLVLRPEATSEVFVPAVFLSAGHGSSGAYPPNRPRDSDSPHNWARIMWRDLNGDGQMDEDEFVFVDAHQNMTYYFIDNRGDLWEYRGGFKARRAPEGQPSSGFVRFKLQGFDEHDNPIWDFDYANSTVFARPAPFAERERHEGAPVVQRFYYDAGLDRMFITGYPDDYDGPRGAAGAALARYDYFTDPDRRERVSLIELPINPDRRYHHIQSVAMVGDLAFAGLGRAVTQEASILVYNTRTGEYLGAMFPGPKLWGETSWLDIAWAVNAFARENGEIIVTVENNWKNLQTVYRIPPQRLVPRTPPSGWDEKKPAPLEGIDPGLK
ncbi:MAG: hypothetical protein R6X20_02525 [Phycisphaerae bacterium]